MTRQDVPTRAEVVDRLGPLVRLLAWQVELPEGTTRDDAFQQAWLETFRALDRYEPKPGVDLAAYVTIQVRWALVRWRAKQLDLRGRDKTKKVVYSRPHDRVVRAADQRPDPSGELDPVNWLTLRRVKDWEIVWAVAVAGYSFTELAERLGQPRSSVFDRYRRALRLLRAEW